MENVCHNSSLLLGATMLFNVAVNDGSSMYSNSSALQAPTVIIQKITHENTASIINSSSMLSERAYSESRKEAYIMEDTKKNTSTYENIPNLSIKNILELNYYEDNTTELLHVKPRKTINLAENSIILKRAEVSLVDLELEQATDNEIINIKPRMVIQL